MFGPKHSEDEPDVTETTIEHMFLLMGASLQVISEAGPGCIVGIGGLEETLLKTGTISSHPDCPSLSTIKGMSKGLVKVTLEAEELSDGPALKLALIQLNKADPSVDIIFTSHGEKIISTCGQVHLEKCLEDLKKDYAPGITLEVGQPIIPFRETIMNKLAKEKIKKEEVTYEELNSSSSSEDDDNEETKDGDAPKEKLLTL